VVEIALNQGRVALIDDEDMGLVSGFAWRAYYRDGLHWYAHAQARRPDRTWTKISMHRLIMGLVVGDPRFVDHINNNGLDNRRHNMRFATPAENVRYCRPDRGSSSRFKGVTLHRCGRWQAQIVRTYIGLFASEEDAARAYDEEAARQFGEFAWLNFPAVSS
jgi:hypothetical protein